MTRATLQAVGLSVGATTLAAVTSDTAVRRSAVLTLFDHRPPTVGHPWEQRAALRPGARGLVMADFVDRVGDPVAMLASDGSSHRADAVLAEALRVLAATAADGRGAPALTAVTYPAHWRAAAVDALRRALRRVPEWSRRPVTVLPDATAALTALQRHPGLPVHGVIAVCDLGGTGTTITLADAEHGYAVIGEAVRHGDFSGDLIDQALLTHVVGDLARAGALDMTSTSAIGALSQLRGRCRRAKEHLSASAVAVLPVELPGFRADVRLTRAELDGLIRQPLVGLVDAVRDILQRNGIPPTGLAAVATVGGGAGIPAVTTTLSEQLRVPVITGPRPELAAATGAALNVLGAAADDGATAMAPTRFAGRSAPVGAVPEPPPAPGALAWSEVEDAPEVELSGLEPLADYRSPADAVAGTGAARPLVEFEPSAEQPGQEAVRWYRRPAAATVAAAAVVFLTAAGGLGVALTRGSDAAPLSTPVPSVSTPAQSAPPTADTAASGAAAGAPPPAAAEPPPRTVTAVPAPVTRTVAEPRAAAPDPVPASPAAPVTETVTETVTPDPADRDGATTVQESGAETPSPPAVTESPAEPAPTSAPPATEPPTQTDTSAEPVSSPAPGLPLNPPDWLSQLPTIPGWPEIVLQPPAG